MGETALIFLAFLSIIAISGLSSFIIKAKENEENDKNINAAVDDKKMHDDEIIDCIIEKARRYPERPNWLLNATDIDPYIIFKRTAGEDYKTRHSIVSVLINKESGKWRHLIKNKYGDITLLVGSIIPDTENTSYVGAKILLTAVFLYVLDFRERKDIKIVKEIIDSNMDKMFKTLKKSHPGHISVYLYEDFKKLDNKNDAIFIANKALSEYIYPYYPTDNTEPFSGRWQMTEEQSKEADEILRLVLDEEIQKIEE